MPERIKTYSRGGREPARRAGFYVGREPRARDFVIISIFTVSCACFFFFIFFTDLSDRLIRRCLTADRPPYARGRRRFVVFVHTRVYIYKISLSPRRVRAGGPCLSD